MMRTKMSQGRLIMGCSMSDFAKAIAISSITQKDPDISEPLLRCELFLRFYGNDFDDGRKQRILDYLSAETFGTLT